MVNKFSQSMDLQRHRQRSDEVMQGGDELPLEPDPARNAAQLVFPYRP